MSRCYPYPPPGYKEKAQVVDLGLSTKKEKHRHKEKKKKRRRDSETNGSVHDKDKRSNKIHRTEVTKNVHHKENGRIPETKLVASPTAVDRPLDRIQIDAADRPGNERHVNSSCQPALYNKEYEVNGKVDSELPLILRGPESSSGTGVGSMTPSSRHFLENHNSVVRQRHTYSSSQVEGAWSAVDDQEWLFLHDNHLHLRPKAKVEEGGGTSQVWAEVLHLPTVDMYALPYVIPY